jgi:pimeloyl-ACP methyl ester carboxylesterase
MMRATERIQEEEAGTRTGANRTTWTTWTPRSLMAAGASEPKSEGIVTERKPSMNSQSRSLQGKPVEVLDDELGRLHFNVVDQGKGDPVLLLHGFPDSAEVWHHQVRYLERGFRVIAPDLRGFGNSAKPPGVALYKLDRIVGDVVGILQQVVPRTPVHVVGHDWGAVVGWVMASMTRTQSLVRSLVAMSVAHPLAYKKPTIEQREKSWYIYFFQHPRAEHAIMNDPKFLSEWSKHQNEEEINRWREDLGRTGALTAALNWYRANASPDPGESIVDAIPELVKRRQWTLVRVPTLGVSSTRDPHLTPKPMRESREYVADPEANWQYEELQDTGHWLQIERPDAVNKMLMEHLTRASSSKRAA